MTCGLGCSSSCWLWMVGSVLVWLTVSSVLLYYVWNQVVAVHTKAKKGTCTQAFLVMAFVTVIALPCVKMGNRHQGGCNHGSGACPYSNKKSCDKCGSTSCQGDCDHKGSSSHRKIKKTSWIIPTKSSTVCPILIG